MKPRPDRVLLLPALGALLVACSGSATSVSSGAPIQLAPAATPPATAGPVTPGAQPASPQSPEQGLPSTAPVAPAPDAQQVPAPGGEIAPAPINETVPATPLEPAAFVASPPVLRVLTPEQYVNGLHDLFGPDVPVPDSLQAVSEVNGSQERGATSSVVQARTVKEYERGARAVAAWLFKAPRAERDNQGPCVVAEPTDACIVNFLGALAQRAWRRPLTPEESTNLGALVVQLHGALQDAEQAFELATSAVLESPHFLYRVETGEVDPSDPTRNRYTSVEMASRLSFALWGSVPDEELLSAGIRGELVNPAGLKLQVDRLLQSDRAEDRLVSFLQSFYGTNDLASHTKNIELFPEWTPELVSAAEKSTELTLRALVAKDADFREVLTGTTLFVNSLLADFYGIATNPANGDAEEFFPVSVPERPGVMGSFAWLSRHAEADVPSVMARGNAVLGSFLCSAFVFPEDVIEQLEMAKENENIPPAPPGLSAARAEAYTRMESAACGSCHKAMDPIGLALEQFDAVGRTTDGVDTSGTIQGNAFDGIEGLVEILAQDPRANDCIATRLYEHLNGRSFAAGDRPVVDLLNERYSNQGFSIRHLLAEAVVSDGFRFLKPNSSTSQGGK